MDKPKRLTRFVKTYFPEISEQDKKHLAYLFDLHIGNAMGGILNDKRGDHTYEEIRAIIRNAVHLN
jgi:hypothetical protein